MLSLLSRARITVVLAVIGLGILSGKVSALQPPRPGELEEAAQQGDLEKRLEQAESLKNNQTDPRLVWRFKQKQMRAAGLSEAEIASTIGNAPPPGWRGGLPATGTPKTFVLLVDFSDFPHSPIHDRANIESKFFGDGDLTRTPYESLRNYYQRASYDQLTIQGTVFDWYRAQYPRAFYEAVGFGPGQELLMEEALTYWNTQGHDFSQYDNDNDGTIDAFFIKWTGPDNGWANFWWAYQWGWHVDPGFTLDGKSLGAYVWSWVSRPTTTAYQAQVDIHETGHLLGLPDLYDYNGSVGPDGGVGGLDMMDYNWGDHNCFSKYMLGWLTPTVISSGTQTRTLNPSGTSQDCVLIMPGVGPTTLFGEFFMAQYRKRSTGNDPPDYPTDGMAIWHIDSTLTSNGYTFLYDNSETAHKYVRLMEADGLEEIEQNKLANAGDFYLSPQTFRTRSVPNSRRYSGQVTGVTIDQLEAPGATMTGRFQALPEPDIVTGGTTLVSESLVPANNNIDPAETVTLNIALRNLGTGGTTNLTAALLATGGVTAPSGPQTYGAMSPNGPAVSKSFTFTAQGECGGTITLSLQLNDGSTDLGMVSVEITMGIPVVTWSQNFDGVTAPALPTGWAAVATPTTAVKWKTTSTQANTLPNSVFAPNPDSITDSKLESSAISIKTAYSRLKFRHKFGLEASYDGGVLEISVAGGVFTDILNAGATFEAGGYNNEVNINYGNPLAGRKAWSGTSAGYWSTVVKLPADLAGKSVKFRWRVGTDEMYDDDGWYVDSITLEDGAVCWGTVGVVVSSDTVIVPEGSTKTFQVKLNSPPLTSTVVTVSKQAGGDNDLWVQGGASLTFTTANYNAFQTVTLTAAEDADGVDGEATFLCQGSGVVEAQVLAKEDDNDTYELKVDPKTLVIPEGGTKTFQIKLGAMPLSPVTVTVAKVSGDPDITAQPASLDFSQQNWNTYQTVTVTAADDPDATDGQATFVCQGPGLTEVTVSAIEDDDDGYVLKVTPQSLSVAEGGTGTFQVKLGAMPPSPVTVTVGKISGDPDITAQPTSLLFNDQNWDTYQTVTVTAADDPDAADEQALFNCTLPGWVGAPVSVFVDDNDVLAIETSASSVSIPEGGLASFQVRLTAAPTEPLTVLVQLESGDGSIVLKGGSVLRFSVANFNAWQTVTLAAESDPDAVDGKAVIRCSGTGLQTKYVDAIEDDDDILEIVMETSSLLVREGLTNGFPIKLGAQPTEDTTVSISIEGDPDLTLLTGKTVTFTPSDWNVVKTVTIEAAQDADIASGQATVRCVAPGMLEKTLVANESDDDTPLKIVPSSTSVTVGEMQTASFTVKLSAQPNDSVTVNVGVVPGDPDITLQSAGQLLFTPTGPSAWNAPQTVIVAAARDLDIENGQSKVLLSGTDLSSIEVKVDECDDGVEPPVWYEDADGDGAGNATRSMPAWTQPAGYVNNDSDCNDADPEVYPGAAENCENLVDDNCDGKVNEDCPPPDGDGDGVADDSDECPNTPAGTQVAANGCPPPPVDNDADDDGVLDSVDQCPNTPAGTTVAANGCPPPPVDNDADDDGVLDNVDQCPNTPKGTAVGADGCAAVIPNPDGNDDGNDGNDGDNGNGNNNGSDEPAGQDQPDDLNDNNNSPAASPLCGLGLAETVLGMLLCLTAVQLRRRA